MMTHPSVFGHRKSDKVWSGCCNYFGMAWALSPNTLKQAGWPHSEVHKLELMMSN
jgi:hypothetical protein